jgi:ribonuclease Z
MSELRVVFLGTSSGKPTLARNVASVALMHDGSLVLFDCGEGTQVQFMRARLRPSRVVLICITHFHGDHINGLPGFLSTMVTNQHDKPVVVAGPPGLKAYFRTLRQLGIFVPRFRVVLKELRRPGSCFGAEKFTVRADRVDHRIETWAFRFQERDRPGRFDLEAATRLGVPRGPLYGRLQRGQTVELDDGRTVRPDQVLGPTRPGRAVAYITDTRPCPASERLADGVDLLVHEGTYAPELLDQASERGHSTVTQAAEIAAKAAAKRLVLTHISPKHEDIRPLLAAARDIYPGAVIARDLMEMTIPAPE